MTVTREQAQMLTALAIACRPYRAPTWDEAGVMAAIGKLHTWQLSEVALRVIVAAADQEARSPAVIVSPSMRVPELKPPKWEPDSASPHERCSTCDKRESECRSMPRFPGDDHVYVARHVQARPIDLKRTVQTLRAEIQPAPAPTTPPGGHPAATTSAPAVAESEEA